MHKRQKFTDCEFSVYRFVQICIRVEMGVDGNEMWINVCKCM